MTSAHLLVVDDEPDIRTLLRDILEDEGYEVSLAAGAEEARHARRQRRPDLTLLDIWMPDTDGISLLKEWAEAESLDSPVVMMSGHGTVETAVEATRLGAYDFIEKPLSLHKVLVTVSRALEAARLTRENLGLRRRNFQPAEAVGSGAAIKALKSQLERISGHGTSVFMVGESGSGKETFARFLHQRSPRAAGPFIDVNVAALARENPEAELFGAEEAGGRVRYGALERANGGTLFLKDIADLDPGIQARLLGALESRSVLRVNGGEPVSLDVRIVAATRRELKEEVAAGHFRDDLYYHLNVLPLHIPALREHSEDVPELLEYFVEQFAEQEGLERRRFSQGSLSRLRAYAWPGNVRELRNLVQRLLILGSGRHIEVGEVDAALGLAPAAAAELPGTVQRFDLPLREAREQFERAYLEYQLQHSGGSVSKVAERVGMERTHLYRKLRMLGIDPKQIKESLR